MREEIDLSLCLAGKHQTKESNTPYIIMKEAEIDSLAFNGLRSLCKNLELATSGKTDELRQRLKDHFAQPPTPRLSDIDEEDGEESDESGETVRNHRRSSFRGRSTGRARSLSRDRRDSVGGGAGARRRSISTPKTPTPINDLLMRSEEPYEASPQRTDQIERRLSIIEERHLQWDAITDQQRQLTGLRSSFVDDIASLEKKTNERQNDILCRVKEFLKKQDEKVNDVSASIAEAKGAIEKQNKSLKDLTAARIESVREELSQSVKNVEEKLNSAMKTVDDMRGKYQEKMEKLGNEIYDIRNLNGDFVDEFKLLNQSMEKEAAKQTQLKSDLSVLQVEMSGQFKLLNQNMEKEAAKQTQLKSDLSVLQVEMSGLKSWIRRLLFMFFLALLVLVLVLMVHFAHIDAASVSKDVLVRAKKMYSNGLHRGLFNLYR